MEVNDRPDDRPAGGGMGWGIRRMAAGMNSGVALALAALLLLMVNYLSYRHYRRWDWSREGYYTLSDKTVGLLNSLTGDVRVVVFFQPQQDIYEDVRNLLKEYESVSRRVQVEWVDPDRDLARTEELLRRFAVTDPNVAVFEAGGRTKYVSAGDVVEMDYAPLQRGRTPEVAAFKGEQAFSSAIQSVAQAHRPVVYFLQGHGERDIEDFGRTVGYSDIAQAMQRDNIEVRMLTLGRQPGIPEDGGALIIAGPDKAFSEAELDLIGAYLNRRGRLMVLLDAMTRTGLDGLLADWGIRVGEDVVVDAGRTLTGRELFVTEYDPYPITRGLGKVSSVFYLPRSVEPDRTAADRDSDPADRPHVSALASSSPSGWAETDLAQSPMKYDVESDRPGPVAVAAAAEKGAAPGMDLQIQPTRVVAFGDSDFVANGAMTGGNADFFLSALNWLLEREALMAISPKPVAQARLIMTRSELQGLFWVLVCGLPALVAALGGLVWLKRRK